jgi:pseudouridine kinase
MNAMPSIICLGAMLWDLIGHSAARLAPGDDVPGRISQQPGGVALNVALALARQGLRPAILSSLGMDASGEALIAETRRRGVDTRWLSRQSRLPTDSYMAIESPDGLVAAIADTRALEAAGEAILAPLCDGRLGDVAHPWRGTLVVDGNLTPQALDRIACDSCLSEAALRIVPASPDKAARLRPLLQHPRATFHLNRAEAEALVGESFDSAAHAAETVVAHGAARVLVTDGRRLAADALRGADTLTETPPPVDAIRVTGAGDAFLAAHFAAELTGAERTEALSRAIRAAASHITAKDLS